MNEPTNENDIDALLRYLHSGHTPHWYDDSTRWHAAITALVAERDALKQRVAELESHPPAASDLRERLVCAIWPEIIRQWREYKDAIDPRGCARADALEEADKMLAAMRKGDSDGK